MNKNILLLLLFSYFLGNAQEYSTKHTIIPAPNFYKANGDSLIIKGQIRIKFEKQKFTTKELKTAQIF